MIQESTGGAKRRSRNNALFKKLSLLKRRGHLERGLRVMNHLDGRPAGLIWNYDKLEIIADGVFTCGRADPGLGGYPSRSEQFNARRRIRSSVHLFGRPARNADPTSTDDLPESFEVSRRAAIPRHVPSPKLPRKHSGASPSSRLSPL
jgi:hypothetical protein